MGSRRQTLTVALLCCAWYVLSSSSNVVGKLLLQRVPAPLTATLAQLAAAAALSGPALSACRVRTPPPPPRYWRSLLPLAAAKLATMLLSQISIWRMPVSYAHTVKATTPLWTALVSRVAWGERQPARVLAALGLLAGGVALASLTERQADAVGLAAALAAAALLALQHLYSKRALRRAGDHPLVLLRALSLLALVPLVPLWAVLELPTLRSLWSAEAEGTEAEGTVTAALLAADAALAWLQAVAALAVLARLSPLGYGVASAAKRAAVVGASVLVLRNPTPPLNVAGMALAAAGVLAYNRAKASERSPSSPSSPSSPTTDRRPLLPV